MSRLALVRQKMGTGAKLLSILVLVQTVSSAACPSNLEGSSAYTHSNGDCYVIPASK